MIVSRCVGLSLVAALAAGVAACSGPNRAISEPTPAALTEKRKGVAVLKHAVLDAGCIKQAALIGVAEGTGHRVIRRLEYGGPAGPNPASIATIAELELEPGTYHVLRLACQRARSVLAWGSMGGTFSSSLASFEVRAGEVVNVGYLTAEATGAQKQLRLNLQDIPVLDLKRYAAERPAAYAAMVTRFAIPLPDKAQLCLYAQDEKAQGKRAQVPSGCT